MMCNRRRLVDYLPILIATLSFIDVTSAFSLTPTQSRSLRRKLGFPRSDSSRRDPQNFGKFHWFEYPKSCFFNSSCLLQGNAQSSSTSTSSTLRASSPALDSDSRLFKQKGLCKPIAYQNIFSPRSSSFITSFAKPLRSCQPRLAKPATKSTYKFTTKLFLATQSSSDELTSQSTWKIDSPMKFRKAEGIFATKERTPVLRGLYDIPPKLSDVNITDVSTEHDHGDDKKYVTNVTVGNLPTSDGSGHVLHYEVHHRIPQKNLRNDNVNDNEVESNLNNHTTNRGIIALFLHGGPGSGCFPNHVRFFSPELYEYVVLLDQRGCGQSTPLGQVEGQSLELLVEDIEHLRIHLYNKGLLPGHVIYTAEERAFSDKPKGVRPWDLILGGSWGCTLAMAYAHRHPMNVRSMVLRGVCLFRPREIDWLFGDPIEYLNTTGVSSSIWNMASTVFHDGWVEFRRGSGIDENNKQSRQQLSSPSLRSLITQPSSNAANRQTHEENSKPNNRRTVLQGYYHQLLGSDPLVRARAAQSWFRWEMGIYSSGFGNENSQKKGNNTATSDRNDSVGSQTRLVTWNPSTQVWSYEDARVWSNESLVSIDVDDNESSESTTKSIVNESEVQRLRKFSDGLLSKKYLEDERTRISTLDSRNQQPIQIDTTYKPSSKPIQNRTAMTNGKNQTFDPSSFIPAQSMLTCYFSVNDEYVVRPFNSFLSLAPPRGISFNSWYSSSLPPSPSTSSMSDDELSTKIALQNYYPLPPCIAIQGGNDAICPPDTAIDLHQAWPQLELRIALRSGHSMYDPIIAGEIVKAVDRFGIALRF